MCAEARAKAEDIDETSCCALAGLRWSAKQELGGGEPFDGAHDASADRAVPK